RPFRGSRWRNCVRLAKSLSIMITPGYRIIVGAALPVADEVPALAGIPRHAEAYTTNHKESVLKTKRRTSCLHLLLRTGLKSPSRYARCPNQQRLPTRPSSRFTHFHSTVEK